MPDVVTRLNVALADLRNEPEFKSIVRSAQPGSIRVRAFFNRVLARIE